MHIFIITMLALAACAIAGPVPVPAATSLLNLTNLDGSITTVALPPGVLFQPIGDSPLEKRLEWHQDGDRTDICEDSRWFEDKTTGGSPLVEDCKWIADITDEDKNKGYFKALQGGDLKANGDWTRLYAHLSCTFGIKSRNIFGAVVGTADVAKMIRDSIGKNGDRDRMQWEGQFKCRNAVNDASTVDWAIFYNK